jgi:hypothetical protein
MALQSHGNIPVQDFDRVHRANEPRLRQPIPALNASLENANQTLDKVVATLNRAGSNNRNPIIAGLGGQFQFGLSTLDNLKAAFIFQDRANLGSNLKPATVVLAPGIYGLNHVYGAGQSLAGSPVTGARKNFLRVQSAFGTIEKEFWVKTKDADIVALSGVPVLDPVTLLPVVLDYFIVDASRPWLQIPIDFFVSWNDEFQVLHNAKNPYLDPGFLKSYGGAKFVSFFDTTPGTEGVGVEVNPVNQAPIEDKHLIEIQNTAGLKEVTVRFRSKMGSPYFVDVPLIVNVIQPPIVDCNVPVMGPPETCTAVLLPVGTPLPAGAPAVPSVSGVPVVAGTTGSPMAQDLLVLTIRAAVTSASCTIRVRRWKYVTSGVDLGGVYTEIVSEIGNYIPLVSASATPAPGGPYNPGKKLMIATAVLQDKADLVAYYTIEVVDAEGLGGPPMLVVGPTARDIQFTPPGGTGGEGLCY